VSGLTPDHFPTAALRTGALAGRCHPTTTRGATTKE
jgi:hypothetical protein